MATLVMPIHVLHCSLSMGSLQSVQHGLVHGSGAATLELQQGTTSKGLKIVRPSASFRRSDNFATGHNKWCDTG